MPNGFSGTGEVISFHPTGFFLEMTTFFKTRSLVALLVALSFLVGSIVAVAGLYRSQSQDRDRARQTMATQQALSQVLSLLQDAETGQRGYLLTGSDAYLQPFTEASSALNAKMDALGAQVSVTTSQAQAFGQLQSLAKQKLDELNRTIALKQKGKDSEAFAIVTGNQGKDLMDRARAIVGRLQDGQAAILQEADLAVDRERLSTEIGIGAALLLAVLLSAIVLLDANRQYSAVSTANAELKMAHARVLDEARRRELAEEHLRQSQKMEAIGQLTGGLAHDFNNMLAVIIGSLNLLKTRLARGDTNVDRFVDGALEAGSRAANLTHRLLAFSRQQPLAPAVIDVNRFITGMSEIIRGTLGGDIRIETVLAGGLWRTHADSTQLENAILNLAVNARDAMPDGGKLTIETTNASLDDTYAARHADVPAGQYVMISVTDTGQGMTPEIVTKAFDPYFTTKGVGKGTGLGLSQVMGFVKQSAGHIKIYSEPGSGTAVKIYLPRYFGEETVAAVPSLESHDAPDFAKARVLIVEDDERMRTFVEEAFRELGFHVVSAPNGLAGLKLLDSHADVALLFTDVVMPEMNGRKLADEALRRRPSLRVIFTTGFSRNAVIHNGVLDKDVNFLAKPFTFEQLTRKVREVMRG
jgi:signal transduction histidine kinase